MNAKPTSVKNLSKSQEFIGRVVREAAGREGRREVGGVRGRLSQSASWLRAACIFEAHVAVSVLPPLARCPGSPLLPPDLNLLTVTPQG